MIAFKVSLNGKRVCIAGAEDLGVLSTIIAASGKLGKKAVPSRPGQTFNIYYSVGGLTSRKNQKQDYHLDWESVTPLQVGDVIQVEIVEATKTDRAKSQKKQTATGWKSLTKKY